jgi:tRNA (guanosine-2'-O-)-methyltransferase
MTNDKRIERIDEILGRKQPALQVMLEDVHSSQNLSAIVRSCDAVGVLDLYYSSADDQTLRIHKTITQGAHRWIRQHRVSEADKAAFLDMKKSAGFQIVVTHLGEEAVSFREADYTQPTVLVMGNEKEGVSPGLAALADQLVTIPMQGMVQSLNVSVAAALILYEAQRQLAAAGRYATPQIPAKEREAIKEAWLYRDTIARRSKGSIPSQSTDEVVL